MELESVAELPSSFTWTQRTRFLPALDEMLRQDRRGAIDDMLNVLRERGVLRQAAVSRVVRDDDIDRYGADFVEYERRQIADMIGAFLHDKGRISFKTKPLSYDVSEIVGTIEVVTI
jgi:hypothetical protein